MNHVPSVPSTPAELLEAELRQRIGELEQQLKTKSDQLTALCAGAVRAKMLCNSIEQFAGSSKVSMGAVYSNTGENKDFADATPSGQLWMQIIKGLPAASFFEPGKNYYVTFHPAP